MSIAKQHIGFERKELLELMIYSAENKCPKTLLQLNDIYESKCPGPEDISKKELKMDECRCHCIYSLNELFSYDLQKKSLKAAIKAFKDIDNLAA
ncbi:hypothetical protein GOV14_02585 [Candidatus Pacearchaeota archaeon]|nr:hypothetical protein [Candidatus Pacearchaeota archaeon]